MREQIRAWWHQEFGHGVMDQSVTLDEWLSGLKARCKCGVEVWGGPQKLPDAFRTEKGTK